MRRADYSGDQSASPSWLAARMSWNPLLTNAAAPVMESSTHCTLGRTCLAFRATPACGGSGLAGTGEVEEVRAFSVVEPQRAGDGFDDVVGHAGEVASLEAGVVLHAHAGQAGELGTPQAGHAPRAVGSDSRFTRGDPAPARGQELPDLSLEVHEIESNPRSRVRGRPCENP